MDDLEIVKRCAEKMGVEYRVIPDSVFIHLIATKKDANGIKEYPYAPLYDDAQAMALVKKFELEIGIGVHDGEDGWSVYVEDGKLLHNVWSKDLNRAICECAAKLPD